MTDLVAFVFPEAGREVRTTMINGEPWFVASDVATILGYRMASDATRMLDEDERGTHPFSTPSGQQVFTIINEPGLYAMIMRSNMPAARGFKRWVMHEVLPAIRRTGTYAVEGADRPMSELEMAEKYVLALKRERELEAKVEVLEPSATAWDAIVSAGGDYPVGDAAKMLSRKSGIVIGRDRLFDLLKELNWIYRDSSNTYWLPYQTVVDRGRLSLKMSHTFHYSHTQGKLVPDCPQVRVTAKGLSDLLKRIQAIPRFGTVRSAV